MKARINHVSIGATDLNESAAFYITLFGAEEIDTPNFGFPVRWLRLGDLQIHLFELRAPTQSRHHFAVEVGNFEQVFRETREAGRHDRSTMGWHFNQLPSGQIQLYVRDPGGNLVEVNSASADRLSEETRSELKRLEDRHPQDESNSKARLYLEW